MHTGRLVPTQVLFHTSVLHPHSPSTKTTPVPAHANAGAAAGAVTGLVTTPLDVIKTRLMIQGQDRVYKGVVDCATKIAREEGTAALFRGWEPRVIWIGLGGCVFFTALEEAKKMFVPQEPESCCAGKKKEPQR